MRYALLLKYFASGVQKTLLKNYSLNNPNTFISFNWLL